MKNHIFKFVERNLDGANVYLVKYLKTGGEFSTNHWRDGKAPQNSCPCCLCEIRRLQK